MLGWQRKQEVYGETITTETLKRTAFERIGRKPKVKQRRVEFNCATTGHNAWEGFFLVVCLKKY